MKLRRRLFISFLAIVLVVTVSIGIGAPILIKDHLITTRQAELSDKGTDLVRFIRDWQEERITYWQFGRLINNLDHFLGARIWILDNQDRLVIASEDLTSDKAEAEIRSPLGPPPLPRNSGSPQSPQVAERYEEIRLPLTEVPGGKEIAEILSEKNDSKNQIIRDHPYYHEDMLVAAIPYNSTRTNPGGTIVFHLPITSIDKFLQSIYVYLGISVLLAILVASILATFLSKTIAGPLLGMKNSAAEMAKGNYNLDIKPEGPEEVKELARSLNSLAHDLDRNMKEIKVQETLRRDFVANVSHELRTPLTIMRGFTEALLDGVITDPQQITNTHQTMRDKTVRLSALITSLLDLSKLQSPKSDIGVSFSLISLSEIVTSGALLFEQPCAAKDVSLLLSLPEKVSPIKGSGDRLTQLLLIFLDNALKFTPPGGTIQISLEKNNSSQTLIISDTGEGIAEEDLPYIWERFYKGDKSRQRINKQNANPYGTGLGLAIAREIIEKHHAAVTVESALGKGTTFKITFKNSTQEKNSAQ